MRPTGRATLQWIQVPPASIFVRPRVLRSTRSADMTQAVTNITIRVPAALRDCCAGRSNFPLAAPSVRVVLEELEQRYPPLYRSVCDETGAVRRHINVFVNSSSIRDREGLDTALEQGDTVPILTAVAGG